MSCRIGCFVVAGAVLVAADFSHSYPPHVILIHASLAAVVVLCYAVGIRNLRWNAIRADCPTVWCVWRVGPRMPVFDAVAVHRNEWSNWYIYV